MLTRVPTQAGGAAGLQAKAIESGSFAPRMIDVSDSRHFDLFVIGGGSGGLAAAQRAADHGARAAIAESGALGGTCVNLGCVPKKIMWNAASIAHAIADAPGYGFEISAGAHDWAGLRARRDAYIERLNGIYESNLDKRGVALLRGQASLVPGGVRVGADTYTATHVIIATGGRPNIPEIEGADLGMTSDDFFALDSRPSRVLVVGSGYIAVELGGVFASLGSEVTIAVRHDGVLRDFDPMLREALMDQMRRDGIIIEPGAVPAVVRRDESGLELQTTDARTFGGFDALLWGVGRGPNTAGLGLETAGVRTDEEGFIPVDDWQDTNVDGIHALGDVTGRVALTPVAIAAGRRLADRLFGGMPERRLDYDCVPTVIFTRPPIGTVGMSEPAAHARYGDAVRVYESRFTPMYHSMTERKAPAAVKLVTVGDDERIVGCHVIGQGADEMLQGFAVAMRMGACKRDFDDTVAIHPTTAEELVTLRGPAR
jgi:glutathione reductase (NADPH)